MTGQIIHKPLGVAIPQDILDKAKSNNNYGLAVAYSKKDGKVNLWRQTQQKAINFTNIEDWDHIVSADSEAVFYFVGGFSAKESEFPFYDIREEKNWLWFASEGTCSLFSSSVEPHVFYDCFLKAISYKGACTLLSSVVKQHSFGKVIIINRGLVERQGNWKESDGLFFSNEDHLKKPYYSPPAYSSTPTHTPSYNNKELPIKYPVLHTIPMKLSIGESAVGLRNYYGVPHNTHNYYVDDIFDTTLSEAGLLPMDFIMSVRSPSLYITHPTYKDIESAITSGQPFSLEVERFDLDKNKTCAIVKVQGKQPQKLTSIQRNYIIETLLSRKVRRENPSFNDIEIEAYVEAFKDQQSGYENVTDEHLIQIAETDNITLWKNL